MTRTALRQTAMLAFVIASVTGCSLSQIQSLRYGEPNFNTAVLLPSTGTPAQPIAARNPSGSPLQPAFGTFEANIDTLSGDCTSELNPNNSKVATCVYALKRIIDDQYREYRITLHHLVDGGNAGFDILALGATTAATATGAAAAKTILSAIGAGLIGTKSILNNDLLYKQTIEVVLNQMDTDRDKQFSVMLERMNGAKSGGDYLIGAAKDDLLIYFQDGTFDHGLTSLLVASAANKANCQAQLENTKVATSSQGTTTAGKAAAAATAAPATSAGCPASGTTPAAAGIDATPQSPISVVQGKATVTLFVKSLSDDPTVVSLDNVAASDVTAVTVSGKPQVKPSNSVSLTKALLPAGGGAVVFSLKNIDASKTPEIDASTTGASGKTSYEIVVSPE